MGRITSKDFCLSLASLIGPCYREQLKVSGCLRNFWNHSYSRAWESLFSLLQVPKSHCYCLACVSECGRNYKEREIKKRIISTCLGRIKANAASVSEKRLQCYHLSCKYSSVIFSMQVIFSSLLEAGFILFWVAVGKADISCGSAY